jgi:hypothetical protein
MELEAEVLKRLLLSRRQLLGYAAAGAAVAVARPLVRSATAGAAAAPSGSPGGFLTSTELAIVDAATASIIPTDSSPGARECGVVNYIQSMLSFMPGSDANCDHQVNAADIVATVTRSGGQPGSCRDGGDVDGNGAVDQSDVVAAEAGVFDARPVFAGGPFSGRQPQPHFPTAGVSCSTCHGVPFENSGPATLAFAAGSTVDNYPPKFFTEFLPLSRLHVLSWKIRILGASAVPAVAGNPLATSSIDVDLRNKYRSGLLQFDTLSQTTYGSNFVQLTATQQANVLKKADQNFVTLLTYHTVEGMFSAPEYGGNRDRLGSQLIGVDGDSQPLGYTIYDDSIGGYRERPDKPNSGPNPDETCQGFSDKVRGFLTTLVIQGSINDPTMRPAKVFLSPYCFEV